jgi:hypothetical protein
MGWLSFIVFVLAVEGLRREWPLLEELVDEYIRGETTRSTPGGEEEEEEGSQGAGIGVGPGLRKRCQYPGRQQARPMQSGGAPGGQGSLTGQLPSLGSLDPRAR